MCDSTVDIVLHIENFRNVDLSARGLYKIKLNVYLSDDSGILFTSAVPYNSFAEPVFQGSIARGVEVCNTSNRHFFVCFYYFLYIVRLMMKTPSLGSPGGSILKQTRGVRAHF